MRSRANLIRYMDVSKKNGTPKSSILIGFSIIFTIHFGGKIPTIFGSTPTCNCTPFLNPLTSNQIQDFIGLLRTKVGFLGKKIIVLAFLEITTCQHTGNRYIFGNLNMFTETHAL